jgi:hypothetical protein
VSAGPDFRGGRGAALISWGRAMKSRFDYCFGSHLSLVAYTRVSQMKTVKLR